MKEKQKKITKTGTKNDKNRIYEITKDSVTNFYIVTCPCLAVNPEVVKYTLVGNIYAHSV